VAVEVGVLPGDRVDDAVGVLARGMRDNPLHVAAFGDDPEHRVANLTTMFTVVIGGQPGPLHATRDGEVVGVCGMGPPPDCTVSGFAALPYDDFPPVLDDEAERRRLYDWIHAWGLRDPGEPHFHLGPVAADAGKQGQGIGTAMLQAFADHVDEAGVLGYLETDKAANVGFYEQFGFETTAEETVIGVPNWFMRRAPR